MATITFSVASTLVTGSKTFTLSEADLTRLVNVYGPRVSASFTPAQALIQWATESMTAAVNQTYSGEVQAAANTVSRIAVT